MTETISAEVAAGIEEIKTSNRCNMNDSVTVISIAEESHPQLADYIVKDPDSYYRCLAHGYVIEETVAVEEEVVIEEEVEISEGEVEGATDDSDGSEDSSDDDITILYGDDD